MKRNFRLADALRVVVAISLFSCSQPAGEKPMQMTDYRSMGDSLTRISFDTLRNTLFRQVAQKGLVEAIPFCHLQADSLMQTYSTAQAHISRVSLRFRNPGNAPDSAARLVLERMQREFDGGGKPTALVVDSDVGRVRYYKPIFLQAPCLQCHGDIAGQVKPEVLEKIDALYPGDLARNYRDGDLRGAWQVEFRTDK